MTMTVPPIETHNGCITIRSIRTGEHRTVKISTVQRGKLEGKRIVSLLTGPDNESSYDGFGFVDGNRITVWQRKRTAFFETLARMIESPDRFAGKAEYRAEGRCIRCNRKLTHPESIDSGIGPECAKRE